jgi:hypothetical protein
VIGVEGCGSLQIANLESDEVNHALPTPRSSRPPTACTSSACWGNGD